MARLWQAGRRPGEREQIFRCCLGGDDLHSPGEPIFIVLLHFRRL